jgi:NTP pyrophosphatase (non-canonical NTP hydrolase)
MNNDVLKTILKFRDERDWKQFHTQKNLSMSIAIEAAELMEVFQWTEPADRVSPADRERAKEEIADVAIYLMLLAHDLDIDLEQAVLTKVDQNARKYPVERFKGVYRTDSQME